MAIKLQGMPIKEFESLFSSQKSKKEILVRNAYLIPACSKKLEEKDLTSVLLSSLAMVNEFRSIFSKEIGMTSAGYIKVYTEVSFPQIPIFKENSPKKGPLRLDGLMIQVIGGKIKDATFFETKKGIGEVEKNQIQSYLEIAKMVKVPRLVSISNQFVPSPKDYPIKVEKTKGVELYHLSWRYIIALGSVLLTDNDTNISDPDQVAIMREVMAFFQNPITEIKTFDKMSDEWQEVVAGIRANTNYSRNDPELSICAQDWLQEEQDLSLKLSKRLGMMVDCTKKRGQAMQDRIKADIDEIVTKKSLSSQFKIQNAVSQLNVCADLGYRKIICSIKIQAPLVRATSTGRLNWLKREIEGIRKKNLEFFKQLESSLWVEVIIKGRQKNNKKLYSEIETLYDWGKQSDVDIRAFRISYEPELADNFTKKIKFITEYERTVQLFYNVMVRNLRDGDLPAPPNLNTESADM